MSRHRQRTLPLEENYFPTYRFRLDDRSTRSPMTAAWTYARISLEYLARMSRHRQRTLPLEENYFPTYRFRLDDRSTRSPMTAAWTNALVSCPVIDTAPRRKLLSDLSISTGRSQHTQPDDMDECS